MLNRRILAVIKRELRVKLLSKSFILMTILIPIFMIGIIGIQILIHSFSEDENPILLIMSDSQKIIQNLEQEFAEFPLVKNDKYKISFEVVDSSKFQKRLDELKPAIIDESLTGVIFIPESALNKKEIQYYSSNPNNRSLINSIKGPINKTLVGIYFEGRNITDDEIEFARNDVDYSGFRVTKEENVESGSPANVIIAILFSILLYMSLIFAGQMTMNSVVEEKNNRIIEVLLSSASSKELMTGKILGTAVVQLIQMAIWLIPVMLLITTSWFALPPEFTLQINMEYIAYFLYNFLVALITYVGLFAAVGAIFDNPQDAQSGIWPLLLLIMIPFFIALGMESNPQSPLAKITSMFPFASLMVMPVRMTLIDIPTWQIITSVVINLLVMSSVFPLAGKIYRVGILITGKKPKWSEVVKWLKYKY